MTHYFTRIRMTHFRYSSKKFRYVYTLVNLSWRTDHQLTEIWVENAYDIFEYNTQCSSLYRDSVEQGTRRIFFKSNNAILS